MQEYLILLAALLGLGNVPYGEKIVNQKNMNTILKNGVRSSNYFKVKKALQYHANPNINDPTFELTHKSLLHTAATQGDERIIKALVQAGADMYKELNTNMFSSYGIQVYNPYDPLRWSMRWRNYKALDIFLELGFDINRVDSKGKDLLRWLIQDNPNPISIKNLLALGAQPNKKDREGYTPLIYLIAHGPSIYGFGDGTSYTLLEIIQDLIYYSNINVLDNELWTPLMVASYKSYEDIVEELIKAGAYLNLKNHDGNTAEDIARKKGHITLADRIKDAIQYDNYENTKPLDNAQTKLFFERYANQLNYKKLINFMNYYENNLQENSNIELDILTNLKYILILWHKNSLNAKHALSIVLYEKDTTEPNPLHSVYTFAKKENMRKLGKHIRQWAQATRELSHLEKITPDIASLIGSYCTWNLSIIPSQRYSLKVNNKHEKNKRNRF